MATSLAESAILSSENLQRGVIEAFIQTSPILDRLTPINFEGTAFRYNEESKLPGDSFRAVNEAYPESTGAVSPRIENLALGCAAMTDKLSIEVSDYPNFEGATNLTITIPSAVWATLNGGERWIGNADDVEAEGINIGKVTIQVKDF